MGDEIHLLWAHEYFKCQKSLTKVQVGSDPFSDDTKVCCRFFLHCSAATCWLQYISQHNCISSWGKCLNLVLLEFVQSEATDQQEENENFFIAVNQRIIHSILSLSQLILRYCSAQIPMRILTDHKVQSAHIRPIWSIFSQLTSFG